MHLDVGNVQRGEQLESAHVVCVEDLQGDGRGPRQGIPLEQVEPHPASQVHVGVLFETLGDHSQTKGVEPLDGSFEVRTRCERPVQLYHVGERQQLLVRPTEDEVVECDGVPGLG